MTIRKKNTRTHHTKTMKKPNKGIYWLASYPKSGNTWTRTFIQAMYNHKIKNNNNYVPQQQNELVHEEVPLAESGLVDINALNTGHIASARIWIEQSLGFDIADLTMDEIDHLRPDVYKWYAEQIAGIQYGKIHDAFTYLKDGTPMIPLKASLGTVYLVRNPLDVAISFASHAPCTIDDSIQRMSNPDYSLCDDDMGLPSQLRQRLLSWSDHVRSWISKSTCKNILVIRYEDMKRDQVNTFVKMAKFLQLPSDKKTVRAIVDEISIEKLQEQETKKGFVEKTPTSKRFFRKDIVGDWQQTLTPNQINQIISDHHGIMQQLGYLDEKNQPTALILPENS